MLSSTYLSGTFVDGVNGMCLHMNYHQMLIDLLYIY